MTKNIAVLLTVFNRKEKTLAALGGLFAQQLPAGYDLEVYMVDDGCTDGTPEAVAQQFPQVHVIKGEGNLFWNRGMHLAWETAAQTQDYDFYFWLNDDTILNTGALQVLLQTSEQERDRAIIVGTTTALADASILTYGGRTGEGKLIEPGDEALPCAYFNGNIVLIPQAVYKKLGPNDPVFHHALGDFDYGRRAVQKGVRNVVAPGVLGRCDAHESLPVWCNPKKSFAKRWKAFRSPLGNNPEEFFIYEKRHGGMLKAIFHYLTNHLRLVFPQLWSFKN